MDDLINVEAIRSPAERAQLVERLVDDLAANPDRWENADLPRYLAALAAWLRDSEGYNRHQGVPVSDPPGWRAFAEALLAARVYE